MAITVLQSPQDIQPGYNENVFVVVSPVAGSFYKYKYICNLYDGDGQLITSLKTPAYPQSTSGQCYFNIGRIIENYISDFFTLGSEIVVTSGSAWNRYGVSFGEEYASASGSPVIPSTGFTSTEHFDYWNACLRHSDMIGYDMDDYRITTSGQTGRWLTNRPRRNIGGMSYIYHESTLLEDGWVYGLVDPTVFDIAVKYTISHAGGTSSQAITFPFGTKMIRVPATFKTLDTYAGGLGLSGVTAMSFVVDTAGDTAPVSGTRYYNPIIDGCGLYDRQRVHFLNREGGYDSFTLNMKSEQSESIERKSFQKKVGILSGPTYAYSQFDRANTVFDTIVNPKFYFNSDWLTEEEMAWLEELISSPKIWLAGTQLTSLTIDTNSFSFKKKQNEPLFQIFFESTVTINNQRQRA